MNGKIIDLTWEPGSMTSSSNGANKYDIHRNMNSADVVINHGFGNYKLIEYSKYEAKIILDNNNIVYWDIKRSIKELLGVSRMTAKVRNNIESLLPITIDFTDKILTFTDTRLLK